MTYTICHVYFKLECGFSVTISFSLAMLTTVEDVDGLLKCLLTDQHVKPDSLDT